MLDCNLSLQLEIQWATVSEACTCGGTRVYGGPTAHGCLLDSYVFLRL